MYLDHVDADNPLSIMHMTKGRLNEAVNAVTDDLKMLTERELRRKLEPTAVDYSLRVSFWREYEAAVRERREYVMANSVIGTICSDAYFYQRFLKDPIRVAWLIKPVQSYMKEIEAVLFRGTERLWELMDMDITITDKKSGDRVTCPRLATVLLETIKMVEARAKGHAMMRSEMRSVALNLNAPQGVKANNDHNTLQARMKELSQALHGDIVLGSEVEEMMDVPSFAEAE